MIFRGVAKPKSLTVKSGSESDEKAHACMSVKRPERK